MLFAASAPPQKQKTKQKNKKGVKSIETHGISIAVSYTIPHPHRAIGSRRGLIKDHTNKVAISHSPSLAGVLS